MPCHIIIEIYMIVSQKTISYVILNSMKEIQKKFQVSWKKKYIYKKLV